MLMWPLETKTGRRKNLIVMSNMLNILKEGNGKNVMT